MEFKYFVYVEMEFVKTCFLRNCSKFFIFVDPFCNSKKNSKSLWPCSKISQTTIKVLRTGLFLSAEMRLPKWFHYHSLCIVKTPGVGLTPVRYPMNKGETPNLFHIYIPIWQHGSCTHLAMATKPPPIINSMHPNNEEKEK